MSRAASQYHIGSPTRTCAATARVLGTGEPYVAALVQAPDSEELQRLDFSAEAWNQGARPTPPLLMFGYWRGTIPEPGARKRILIDDTSLLELFEQTEEGPPPVEGEQPVTPQQAETDRKAFRFVLALILMRKRLLVCERNDGGVMYVRPKGTPKPPEGPPLVEVVDPGLDEATIARVTGQLSFVLSESGSGGPPSP